MRSFTYRVNFVLVQMPHLRGLPGTPAKKKRLRNYFEPARDSAQLLKVKLFPVGRLSCRSMCTSENGTGSFRQVKYFTNEICSSKNHISGINVNNCEPFCGFPIHTMPYQISVPAQKLRAVGDSVNLAYNQAILFIFL